MKILIQRVTSAKVEIDRQQISSIENGALIFVGVTQEDTAADAAWLANKFVNLRMFEDDQGKMNLSILEKQGQVLAVSQFTLYGDCSTGRRPSFTKAAPPALGKQLYEEFIMHLRKCGVTVETGVFGAEMSVSLCNDGPVTFLIEYPIYS